jgi:pilus assembly protein CpaD
MIRQGTIPEPLPVRRNRDRLRLSFAGALPRRQTGPTLAGSALAALLLLGACTTPASGLKKNDAPPVNPGELYKMQAEQAPDEIRLGQHPDGLSDHQRAAIGDYARGYIEAGGEQVVIRTPAGGGEAAARMAQGAKAALEAAGLSAHEIALDVYNADQPGAPIRLVYERWRAKSIACGQSWNSLTNTRDNEAQSNFGCAVTANMAAQIADPRDINGPRNMDASDAARRATVLDKYRKGEVTSAQADDKSRGTVTQEIQ